MAIRMSGTPPWEYKARMFKYTNEDLIKTDKTLFQYIALISKYEAYYTAPEHQRQLIGDDAVGRSIAFFDKRKFTEPHGFFVQHKPMEREVYLHMEFDYRGKTAWDERHAQSLPQKSTSVSGMDWNGEEQTLHGTDYLNRK